MGCGWGVSKAGNLTKCVHSQGAVEWRVPIVWEMNKDDAQSEKCDVASKWAMDGECCQSKCIYQICALTGGCEAEGPNCVGKLMPC